MINEIVLSEEQEIAVENIRQWFKGSSGFAPVFRLYGYAGTGKTTIAKYISESIGEEVGFVALTGKAASVLRSKGCVGAKTIHSLIYRPVEKSVEHLEMLEDELSNLPTNTPLEVFESIQHDIEVERENCNEIGFSLNLESEIRSMSLVIVDECSMVNETVGEHLESFGIPILALGDPAQLPPPFGDSYFDPMCPEYMLTEVHRHALESPVYRWATKVRSGEGLDNHTTDEESWIKPASQIMDMEFIDADAIIAGKNKTRHWINDKMRRLLGFADERDSFYENRAPFVEGETLACVRNNNELGLMNGVQYTVRRVGLHTPEFTEATIVRYGVDLDLEVEIDVQIMNCIFYRDENRAASPSLRGYSRFDYGYCLTCHKSQGSQWETVCVIDESGMCSTKQEQLKWLYTAITRASERIWIGKVR